MAHPTISAPALVQSFRRRTIKYHQTSLTWENLSNNWETTDTVPGASTRMPIESVVHKVSDDMDNGSYSVTVLAPKMVAMSAIGGGNTALGQEGNASSQIVTVYYNVQRFPVVVGDAGVTGRMAEKFYNLTSTAASRIADLFAKQTDRDHFKALLEGADEFLTSSAYWESADRPSAISKPMSQVFHPNFYAQINGAPVKNTWNATFATAMSNFETATDTEIDNDDTFSLASLDIMHLIAARTINPLPGVKGNSMVKWVCIISDSQWYQMNVDTTSNASIRDLMKYTDKGFQMLMDTIPGAAGIYKNMLIVVSQSSPIYYTSGSAGSFQYLGPLSDARTRTAWVDSNPGSMELAFCLGNGAILLADVQSIDYERENLDYNFSKNMCGIRARGTVRCDLDATVAATSARVNQSSFVYATATNSIVTVS